MLPFSVPVVVLLSLLVREVCDSLLGNPSYMKQKWQVNIIKYRPTFPVKFFYISWVVLRDGSEKETENMATLPILVKQIREKISLFRPIRNRKDYS